MSEADSRSRMLPTDRIVYSAIADRPPLRLPNNARMVVWVIVNVEEWDPTQTMPRTVLTPPAGGAPMPDIPNWAWHEYGNRVGFWRILKVFDEFAIPGVLAINGSALAAYKPIVEAAFARRWEFMGHGFTQRNMQKVEDERADIRKTRAVIEQATGKAPRGWLGPKPGRRRTFSRKKATTMWPTGCSTTSRCGSRPAPSRSSTFPTPRNATTSP
jgi:hypothetical protein